MGVIFFELFRPRVKSGRKQKVDLQNFVPEGHPNVGIYSTCSRSDFSMGTLEWKRFQIL